MKKLAMALAGLILVTVVAVTSIFVSVGGSLVSTRGISMQPLLHQGDLAVVLPAADYAVGDIASYHSTDLDTLVLHRIVAVDGDRYTFQGDHNIWLDPEQPTRERLKGKLALRVPQGGVWLERMTSPVAVGLIAFVLLVSGGTAVTLTRRDRRRARRAGSPPLPSRPPMSTPLPARLRTAAAATAAVLVASSALAVFAWTRPLTAEVASGSPTTSEVTFSYHATVPRSAAYDDTSVAAPQPVFRRLADEVTVAFAYEADEPAAATQVRATAELSTSNGWRSRVQLAPAASFSESSYDGHVFLRLDELQARADAAAAAIGDEPAGDVSIVVVPEFSTESGRTFRPELPFILTARSLQLAAGDEAALTVDHSGPGQTVTGRGPATLAVLGRSILVSHVRHLALGALGLGLVAALILAVLGRRARRASEQESIHGRYASILLPVDPIVLPAGRPLVDVPQIDALVRLAERYGLLVLHWARGDTATYVVLDDSTTYRYRTTAPAAPSDNDHNHSSLDVAAGTAANANPA